MKDEHKCKNYCFGLIQNSFSILITSCLNRIKPDVYIIRRVLVEEDGFEPSKSKTTDLQSAPFGHLGTPPYEILKRGAGGRIRTPDLLITNQLLYQLSYTSVCGTSRHQRVWHITFAAKVIIAGVPHIVNTFSQKNQSFFQQPRNPWFRGCNGLISHRRQ